MENDNLIKLKSQENLATLKALSEEVCVGDLRLMIDPQKATSAEGIIEDVLLYLKDKKSGRTNSKLIQTISLK